MLKVLGERGSGKTTKLIYISAITGKTIVVATRVNAEYIENLAKHFGVKIPKVYTISDYIRASVGSHEFDNGILVDELEDCMKVICHNNIDAYSMTKE